MCTHTNGWNSLIPCTKNAFRVCESQHPTALWGNAVGKKMPPTGIDARATAVNVSVFGNRMRTV